MNVEGVVNEVIYQVSEFDLKVTDHAFEDIKKYNPTGADEFTLGLISVFLCAISREYEQLRSGLEKYTGLEAWACRNLLEIDIFVKWVLRSDGNAKRFSADVAVDGTELFESMKDWMLYQEPGTKLPELDQTLRINYERRAREGTTGKKHLEIRELAEAGGMTADFKKTMKLCSKLVHVTAWSLITVDDQEGEHAAFRVILFQSGARYGLDAFNTIREYLEALQSVPPASP